MTAELVSIREAAELLGVSQLRVRELIKKNKLQAQKVAGDGGERWAIVTSSAKEYLKSRPEAVEAPNGSVPRDLRGLLGGLERQLERVRTAIVELSKAQAYIDGLRAAERALQQEITALKTPKSQAAPAVEVASEPEAPAEPEPAPANGTKKKPKPASKATTSLGQALEHAGVAQKQAKATKRPSKPK